MELTVNDKKAVNALLVGVDTGEYDAESSMEELFELAKSAGAQAVASISQKLDKKEPATCVKSGKLQEIKTFCEQEDIELIIFDTELSPVQIRNIEEITDVRVIDRTMLILDIFALRAKSAEGKIQVELAQLKYMLPRLSGKGVALSRLGGGIGTRGPGETKLETDRRHINTRIQTLKAQLKNVEEHRALLRRRRKKDGVITVAIVGYTNAGKSTLMNFLTDAGVLSEDKLFATLDPTSRALKLKNGASVMLIDTVGLVRRLPHHLVEAFKSTLEEAAEADIILNVCDASSEEARLHLEVTNNLLYELGCKDKPIIPVLNKCDLSKCDLTKCDLTKCDLLEGELVKSEQTKEALLKKDSSFDDSVCISGAVRISAKYGTGIDELLKAIENSLPKKVKRVKLLLPFDKAKIVGALRKDSVVYSEEYTAQGIEVDALIDEITYNRLRVYIADR